MSTVVFTRRQEIARRDHISLRDSFGPLIWSRLEDPAVTDVMLNGNGTLYEDRSPHGLTAIGTMSEHDAQSIINLVASVAGEIVDRNNPIVEAELPIRNARFIGFIRPIVAKPSFAIRLPPSMIYDLASYVEGGIATQQQVDVLEYAVRAERNILIAGGTASGKTTLMNAVLEAVFRIWPDKRIGLIEEIIELQFKQPNVLALRTGSQADHQDLLKRLMRSRPDIIVFGEVRDKAALQLVKASNTGHGSVMSTVHANTPQEATGRMEDLCAEALPGVNVRGQIAAALGIIVGIERIDPAKRKPGQPGRRITEIIEIKGIVDGAFDYAKIA